MKWTDHEIVDGVWVVLPHRGSDEFVNEMWNAYFPMSRWHRFLRWLRNFFRGLFRRQA